MVHQINRGKTSVYYRQFRGGYARIPASELQAIMEGYKRRLFRRDEVRVFSARWEAAALHQDSRVSLYRIVNCDSKRKGNRRLSQARIDAAVEKLDQHLPSLRARFGEESTDRPKPVPRRVLRHIARGSSTTVEGLFFFAYFMRRIPQRKPMQRLRTHEHYARFRYADFEQWTGVHRTSVSRLLQRLLDRGFVNIAEVHKQNENAYGQLYIDGPMLSLVRPRQQCRRRRRGRLSVPASVSNKMPTPTPVNANTSTQIWETPINRNPKKLIKRPEDSLRILKSGFLAQHVDPDLRRIALRAAQMAEQSSQQAA